MEIIKSCDQHSGICSRVDNVQKQMDEQKVSLTRSWITLDTKISSRIFFAFFSAMIALMGVIVTITFSSQNKILSEVTSNQIKMTTELTSSQLVIMKQVGDLKTDVAVLNKGTVDVSKLLEYLERKNIPLALPSSSK